MNGNIEYLLERINKIYSENIVDEIINGYKVKRKTTLRVNTAISTNAEIEEELSKINCSYSKVSWYKDAYILNNLYENDIINLDIYKEGKIYLQSLSSMIPPLVLHPEENSSILDMAAAPGGKTTQIANLANSNANITAIEKNRARCEKLRYNILKQKSKRINIIEHDARKLDECFIFDKILLDAPCSGSGTIDYNNQRSYKFFNSELVSRSVETQKELIKKASKLLRVGGELVYSTCSILKEENEDVVNILLKTNNFQIVPIDFNLFSDVSTLPVSIPGTMCVLPNENYEGFFVAKLIKIKW